MELGVVVAAAPAGAVAGGGGVIALCVSRERESETNEKVAFRRSAPLCHCWPNSGTGAPACRNGCVAGVGV